MRATTVRSAPRADRSGPGDEFAAVRRSHRHELHPRDPRRPRRHPVLRPGGLGPSAAPRPRWGDGQAGSTSDATDDDLRRIHREHGPAAATVAFLAVTGLDGGDPADPDHLPPGLVANFDVFYRWMVDAIGAYRADVEVLRSRPVVVGVGETSDQDAERAALELARRLGQEPVPFAGDHVGFAEDPERFAAQLAPLLV